MKTLELFRELKADVDLVYAGDYHGDDENCQEAKRAALVRGMLIAHIQQSTSIYLRGTPEPCRTVAQYVINDAIVHHGLLSRCAAMEKAGAIIAGSFKAAENHRRATATAEQVLAAIDSGQDFWSAARLFAEVHFHDAAWFDNQDSLTVMRPTETRVPLR